MVKKESSFKGERFKNVAVRRVQKILDDFDSLSKCAYYSYYNSYEEILKMMKAIKDKTKVFEAYYLSNTNSGKNAFEF